MLGIRTRYVTRGSIDTSGRIYGPRGSLFTEFLAADHRRRRRSAEDAFGFTECRACFVIDRGQLRTCLETTGWACDASGRELDLMALLRAPGIDRGRYQEINLLIGPG